MPNLIRSSFIDGLLLHRNQAVSHAEAAHREIQHCLTATQAIQLSGVEVGLSGGYSPMPILAKDWPQLASAAIDAASWDLLMRESGILDRMNSSTRRQWQAQITNLTTPPLTRENIENTFVALVKDGERLFEIGVVDVFRKLCWVRRKNLLCQMGESLVVNDVYGIRGDVDKDVADAIDDLFRIFSQLDGARALDARSLNTTLQQAKSQDSVVFDTDYCQVTIYPKKRVCELLFTRPDLVQRLNAILLRHQPDALPPANRLLD